MAPPISDAVVVDVLRRIDRLLAPLVGRLGRPRPAPGPSGISGGPTGSPSWPPASPRRRDSSAGWPTCSRCRTPWGRRSSRSSSSGWPPSTTSRHRRTGCRSWRASCWTGTCPAERVEPLLTRARGTYREDALGRAGERGPLRTLWRVTRLLSRIDDALDARPKGRLHHRFLSNLPVVGVLGGYAAEREGLRKAAAAAAASSRARQRIGAATAPSLAGSTSGSTDGSVARFA